jgi:hypothetical protein
MLVILFVIVILSRKISVEFAILEKTQTNANNVKKSYIHMLIN